MAPSKRYVNPDAISFARFRAGAIPSSSGSDESGVHADRYAETPGHLLRRAHQAYNQLWAEIVPAGLTGSQYAILAVLSVNGELDQATVGRLTSLDRSSIAELASRMASRGLIGRRRDELDARKQILRITAEGSRTLAEAEPQVRHVGDRLLAPLSSDERARFLDFLRRVGDSANI